MRVALPIYGNRIAPVLDVAGRFLMVDERTDGIVARWEVSLQTMDPLEKTRRLVELGANVLICGAISWPLEAMLVSAGLRVISNKCGSLQEVVDAFLAGDLTERVFLMPGCAGRRHRHRRGRKGWNR